jgi:acetyl-CoA C-acetyltransferase
LLNPVFKKDGTITAANSSSISDGAAALMLMRLSHAQALGLQPLAKMVAQTNIAQDPSWFTTAPIGAIEMLLQQCQWDIDEVDLFEINEAFAVVPILAMKALHIPHAKLNIHGGACAMGHPLGASGARIIVTLLAALRRHQLKRGVAALCIGGGEATAVAIEIL